MSHHVPSEILVHVRAPSAGSPPDEYPVDISSPLGPAAGTLMVNVRAQVFSDLLRGSTADRPTPGKARELGELLFRRLFVGEIGRVWAEARGWLKDTPDGYLALRLRMDATEVGSLPWELLYEPGRGFLSRGGQISVARYLPVPEPQRGIVLGALRVLLVTARPDGFPDPKDCIVEAQYKALRALPGLEVVWGRDWSGRKVEEELRRNTFHAVQFFGHGLNGSLALVADNGRMEPLMGEQFSQLIQWGRPSLRLVLLAACNSGQQSAPFSGVGPTLVGQGIPAVVAMQYPLVTDETAAEFAVAFFQATIDGASVDRAVNAGRSRLAAKFGDDARDWSTPVLYLGTRDGQVLDFSSRVRDEANRSWGVVRHAVERENMARLAFGTLTDQLSGLVDRQNRCQLIINCLDAVSELANRFDRCVEVADKAELSAGQMEVDTLGKSWDKDCLPLLGKLIRELDSAGSALPPVAGWVSAARVAMDDARRRVAVLDIYRAVYGFSGALNDTEWALRRALAERVAESLALTRGMFAGLSGDGATLTRGSS